MAEEAEGKVRTPGGPNQEEFAYFSISSGPEVTAPRRASPAPEAQGGQPPVMEEALSGEAEMQEDNPTAQDEKVAGEVLQAISPRRPPSSLDSEDPMEEARVGSDPGDALLCPSEPLMESELAGDAGVQFGQHSTSLEEDGQDTARRTDASNDPPSPPDDSSSAMQVRVSMDLSETEIFFDQICHFQSRRMNDQRCSFRKKRRGDDRAWKSAPATPTVEMRQVFFPSTMSLQTEEFFDLVAWAQAHRLNDQRADFLEPEFPTLTLCAPPPGRNMAAEKKAADEARERMEEVKEKEKEDKRKRKQSRRYSTGTPGPPRRAPDEALYNMIINHQSARLEDQRSDPPISAADEDLFELLLRAQGLRMEEQRTELPAGLQQRKISLF